MGYFQVRYNSRVVIYDRRGSIRLASAQVILGGDLWLKDLPSKFWCRIGRWILFFNGPTPASFCLFLFSFSNTNFTENCRRQGDSNFDCWSRRWARWPPPRLLRGKFCFSKAKYLRERHQDYCQWILSRIKTIKQGTYCGGGGRSRFSLVILLR